MARKTQYHQDVSSSQIDLRFNAIQMKIPESYFMNINKLILKFIWRSKRFRLSNTILKEKNKIGKLMLLNFKTYKATVIKVM